MRLGEDGVYTSSLTLAQVLLSFFKATIIGSVIIA